MQSMSQPRGSTEPAPEFAPFAAQVAALREAAVASGQRRMLWLRGDADWCERAASVLFADYPAAHRAWLGAAEPAVRTARRLLGRELRLLVVDAHAGFDPDAFGAASGALRGGGLLVLLSPAAADWPVYADPEHARMAVAPYSAEAVTGRFLRRLVRVLDTAEGMACLDQGGDWRPARSVGRISPSGFTGRPLASGPYRSEDQREAVHAVEAAARSPEPRPVVLIADRGRGKSAALGMAAARLLQGGTRRILVTGPRLDATETLFAHAAAGLPEARTGRGWILTRDGAIEFHPPDALCQSPPPADLLLVEEAAAIPAPLLARLLAAYPRCVFATTVHGYEGSGRGFALRFQRVLDARAPGWHALRLDTPVRWAAGDPLERLVFRALLLDAAPAPEAVAAAADPADCRIEVVDRDILVADEALLGELFGLLVTAHYRTRPYDLRHLLDGPNLSLVLARAGRHVLGAALLAEEGGLDPATARAVFAGLRRLRGHLLPQSLAAHGAFPAAAELRHLRIMRLAVHPAAQGRGLGIRLVAAAEALARQRGSDLLGASFGATPELLRFWERAGCTPLRVGFTREHTSGTHSVIVARGISTAGEALCAAAGARLARDLPYLRADVLRELEPAVYEALRPEPAMDTGRPLTLEEWQELEAFAFAKRGYAASLVPIRKLLHMVSDWQGLEPAQRAVLQARVIEAAPWAEVACRAGVTGRPAALALLREAVGQLLATTPGPRG